MKKIIITGLGIMALMLAAPSQARSRNDAKKCVLVLYDRAPGGQPFFTYGRLMAQMLQNLLGHFPHLQQIVTPIDKYAAGQAEACVATFYLGTYYDNAVPPAFLEDYARGKSTIVWAGYNLWQLPQPVLAEALGVRYRAIASPDWTKLDPKGIPGFFRDYEYLGETFTKTASLGGPGVLHAASDVVMVDPIGDGQVVSWARHSGSAEKVPYVVRKANRWYVADIPFAYMHEEDRYLIFADLLFDMLGEKPLRPGRKLAMVRFEDVHSEIPRWQLDAFLKATTTAGVPFTISLIPYFKDPHDALPTAGNHAAVKLVERPEFVSWLKEAESKGASVVMHGFTHQHDHNKNPDGVSGIDYEFWDVVNNRPVEGDSPEYVLGRLEEGLRLLELAGLKPAAWLTPHYAASPLDNVIFGQLFLWNIGRVGYDPMRVSQRRKLPSMFTFDLSGSEMNGRRLAFFKDLKVEHPGGPQVPAGQFFPYEIYGDTHGIRVIPESVGYIQPSIGYGVDDMLRVLRRNSKLRDAWGSLFVHPFLTSSKANGGIGAFDGDTAELERLFREAKLLGYDFVNLRQWTKANLRQLRPEPREAE